MQHSIGPSALFVLVVAIIQVCALARSDVRHTVSVKDDPFLVPVPERPPVVFPDNPEPEPEESAPKASSTSSVFTRDKCNATVADVQQRGVYTEESITPICERHIETWKRCDFFSEVLSLATSHPDFNASKFCGDMEDAHFCSGIMDDVLVSYPLSDFAYGDCIRARPKKSHKYCSKFRHIFSDATRSDALDTIRACYMIEAYGNVSAAEPELDKGKERIIAGSSRELASVGDGDAARTTPPKVLKFGDSGIVVKPQPLENVGSGKGQFVTRPPGNASAPSPAPSPAEAAPATAPAPGKTTTTVQPIIVGPVPADKAGSAVALLATTPVEPASVKRRPAFASQVFLHNTMVP